ncbi:MAG: hypothetical protein JKY37_34100, partial [Nannocystaceae bacterium]|nr:hypothetical protein [Nannocystaceae bacterium]
MNLCCEIQPQDQDGRGDAVLSRRTASKPHVVFFVGAALAISCGDDAPASDGGSGSSSSSSSSAAESTSSDSGGSPDTTTGMADDASGSEGESSSTGDDSAVTCPAETPILCGDSCVDTSADPQHCGGCETACEADEVCAAGSCAPDCEGETTACSGTCVDTESDPIHCGGCEADCGLAGTWTCAAGICMDLRQWQTAELIETDNAGDGLNPQVAVDADGNAVSVWQQSDGTRHNIWANRYVAGAGWGTPELIETENSGAAHHPHVEIDPNGNAIAVWQQDVDTRRDIWANRYVAGMGWGTAELIETDDTGEAAEPQVVVGVDGNAIAVWAQRDSIRYNIWANRYVVGEGWGTAELIETDNAANAQTPVVAVDPDGNVICVWRQNDGAVTHIWANHYTEKEGWGIAELIETEDSWSAGPPQLAVDPDGNAVSVWAQTDGTRDNVWANHYVAGVGWGIAELIETNDDGSVGGPQVAVDAHGNAISVWGQYENPALAVWANRYIAGVGWGTA